MPLDFSQSQRILSQWSADVQDHLTSAEPTLYTSDIKTSQKFISSITEFLKVNLDAAQTFFNVHSLLKKMLDDPNFAINDTDRELYTQYISELENVISAFESLNYIESILPAHAGPVDALANLNQQISSPQFQRYINSVTVLVHLQEEMGELYAINRPNWAPIAKAHSETAGFTNFISVDSYFPSPYQFITRLGMMADEVNKRFNSQWVPTIANQALASIANGPFLLEITRRMGETLNEQKRAHEHTKYKMSPEVASTLLLGGEKANIARCTEILKLNVFNPMIGRLGEEEREKTNFFDSVFKQLIPADRRLSGKINPLIVDKTLGVELDSLSPSYNPRKFIPSQLQKLYKRDHNPLWLVLKSTLPISEVFSPEEKIQAYIDIARLSSEGKLGKKNKYLVAHEMAKSAYEVAKHYPTIEAIQLAKTAFSPQQSSLSISNQCKHNQFGNWIMAKAAAKENRVISERFLRGEHLIPLVDTPTLDITIGDDDAGIATGESIIITPGDPTNLTTQLPGSVDSGLDASPVIEFKVEGKDDNKDSFSQVDLEMVDEAPLPLSYGKTGGNRFALFRQSDPTLAGIFQNKLLKELRTTLNGIGDPAEVTRVMQEFKIGTKYQQLIREYGPKNLDNGLETISNEAQERAYRYYGPGSSSNED